MSKTVLAFDFGASSGRAMRCARVGGKLVLSEVHRFDNVPVEEDGHLRWNLPVLYKEILTGMKKAVAAGGFDAVGFDSWGVDFGLIGKSGEILEKPVHYRDARNEKAVPFTQGVISQSELYARTGIQFMPFNTVYQLSYLAENEPQKLADARQILLIADLFAYLLTGAARFERTNASTTGLLRADTQTLDDEILRRLKIPGRLFAPLIDAGETYGTVKKEICDEVGCAPVPVVAAATHDTASAVVSVPTNEETVYISCGTWSLMGVERSGADVSDATFTNEIGYGGKIRYLKNIMGLWIIQETRRAYGIATFGEMVALAEKEPPFVRFIDVDDPSFLPPGDMPQRVCDYCRKTGQPVPTRPGEVIRTVYESLALKYRVVYEQLLAHTGAKPVSINMVGGGINAELLCRMAASACGVRVEAGPSEATAMGNAAVQMIALGEIKDIREARDLIRASVPLKVYGAEERAAWDKAYEHALPYFLAPQKVSKKG